MSGALTTLVVTGTENNAYAARHTMEQRRSIEQSSSLLEGEQYDDGRLNTKRLIVSRNGDAFVPKSILIRNPRNFQLKQIKCVIGGSTILSFDAHFFATHTELTRTTEQTIHYTLPVKDYKLDEIFKLVALQYHEVVIKVEYHGLCDRMKLFHSYIFMDREERRRVANETHTIDIIQTQTQSFSFDLDDRRVHHERVCFNGMTNGYYLNGIRKEDLERIQININRNPLIDWEEDEIEEFTTQKGNGIWIPFNDRPLHDFSHSLNQSRIDTISLEFKVKPGVVIPPTEQQSYAVWCNSWNLLRIRGGMAAQAFYWNSVGGLPSVTPAPTQPTERISRPLTDPEYVCPITLEAIPSGGEYHMCHQCNHAFSREQFSRWLQTRNSCPLCRSRNQSLTTVYVNESESSAANLSEEVRQRMN